MPPAVRNISLGTWIAVAAFLLQAGVNMVSWMRTSAGQQEVLKSIGVQVVEIKEAAKEHAAQSAARFGSLEATVNDHEKRVWFLERRTP